VSSTPLLSQNTFTGNIAGSGGAIHNDWSDPIVTNSVFQHNSASVKGGGMQNIDNSNPVITDVTFIGNSAGMGGAIENSNSDPILTNVSFTDNEANSGGAMYIFMSSNPQLTHVTFTNNKASSGGGIYSFNSTLRLENVSFIGNEGYSNGGGMYNQGGQNTTLANTLFAGNKANRGGGTYNTFSSPTLTNVTMAGNNAPDGGGVYNVSGSNPTLLNSLLWGNSSSLLNDSSSTPDIIYSLIEGCNPNATWNHSCGFNLGNNLPDGDPLFVHPISSTDAPTSTGTFRVQPNSPSIDAGNMAYNTTTNDLDGTARIVGATIDLGAYENGIQPPIVQVVPHQVVAFGSTVTLEGTGASDPDGHEPITYQWIQTAGPTVVLSNPSQAQTTFIAPSNAGVLGFTLIVTNSVGRSTRVDVKVGITSDGSNTIPIANAGPDQTITWGTIATLDGSESYDPDGHTPLTYQWTQIDGVSVLVSDANGQQTSFTAPQATTVLVFELQVTDSFGALSTVDTVRITVNTPSSPTVTATTPTVTATTPTVTATTPTVTATTPTVTATTPTVTATTPTVTATTPTVTATTPTVTATTPTVTATTPTVTAPTPTVTATTPTGTPSLPSSTSIYLPLVVR
jgi:predicted outer membrane repeat protein